MTQAVHQSSGMPGLVCYLLRWQTHEAAAACNCAACGKIQTQVAVLHVPTDNWELYAHDKLQHIQQQAKETYWQSMLR